MALGLKNKRVVLLLQGGGALGAYQVGAFHVLNEALKEAHNHIAWVGGISIGAINAAVIAAPKNKHRNATVELDALWHDLRRTCYLDFLPTFDCFPLKRFFDPCWLHALIPKYCNFYEEAALGQSRFFVPKPIWWAWMSQWIAPQSPSELGFYDTTRLRDTLNDHVDWDYLWDGSAKRNIRLLLGATSIRDGELRLFDSFDSPVSKRKQKKDRFIPARMNAEHVCAAGALPPAFPPVEIDGDAYFDGGVSSNTLITELQKELADKDTIVFLLDLWDRKARRLPRSMDEVLWRQKCIQYGSRKRAAESVIERHQLKATSRLGLESRPQLEICQVMYESEDDGPQFAMADADFSDGTFKKMVEQGKKDMQRMLTAPERVDIEGLIQKPIMRYGALYRVGSLDKHQTTDQTLVA